MKDNWDKFAIIMQVVSVASALAGIVFLWGWTLGWWEMWP